ncbi:hypothetical protein GGF31_008438 [Allomyces arbusculus]|nr:hypothetical protein GGF31_008438 [Allomyces arbusculus]
MAAHPDLDAVRAAANAFIASISAELREISLQLHAHPEEGFNEYFAHRLITEYLARKPHIQVAPSKDKSLVTAFVATFNHSTSKSGTDRGQDAVTTIGFCSEYDALPMGHACGHNLIAISGIGAFLTAAHLAEIFDLPVRLKLFGTPGEEGQGGKINMINAGDFADVDFAMMLHPGNIDLAHPTYLAAQHLDVEYFGKEAHAAASPWDGINALDAVVTAFNAIAHLRQQILPTDRIHGVITHGGAAPNIIPAYTRAEIMVRSERQDHLQDNLFPRVMACLESGAAATGCSMKTGTTPAYADVVTNVPMTDVYARELLVQIGVDVGDAHEQRSVSRGSTDMGNVCYVVPSIHNVFDTGCKAEIHSEEFLAHAKTQEAHDKTLQRVACLVMVAHSLMTDADLRSRARAEFAKVPKPKIDAPAA